MSSLMCAATLIVARHADAEYVDKEFSDEGGSLSVEGRIQAAELAERVRDRRVAHVWCSDAARAVQTAEIVAHALGVSVTTRKTLREVHVGALQGEPFSVDELCAVTDRWFEGDLDSRFPDGESGHDVVARYGAALAEIADVHRGETVVVVTHEKAACIALPSLARNATPRLADRHRLDNGESAELVVDGDDWVLARWGDFPAP